MPIYGTAEFRCSVASEQQCIGHVPASTSRPDLSLVQFRLHVSSFATPQRRVDLNPCGAWLGYGERSSRAIR